MGWLERGNDAFELAQELEGGERLVVGRRDVFDPALLLQPGVLGADAGIVEASRDRMRLGDLAFLVLQQIGAVAVQHAGAAAGQRRGMLAGLDALAARLDADDAHALVVEEGMEQAHGVRAAADAGHQGVGQAPFHLHDLLAHLIADHALEVAHHRRIGMGARHRADAVEGRLAGRDPVAQRLVHGVLQRRGARRHRPHFGAQHFHAHDIGRLAVDVDRTHEHHAGNVEQCAGRRGGDAVLARAGLGDHPRLAHALGQKHLAQHVVDLVAAGVIELVALEVDFGAAEVPGQPLGVVERARAAGIMRQEIIQLALELRIGLGLGIGLFQLEDERHQGLGDVAAAEKTEMPALVGAGTETVG